MLDFIVGIITSLLSGMGVGGGGLLVIYLVLIRNLAQYDAQGINLAFFICSSLAALTVHFIRRNINLRLAAYLILFGSIGAVIGSLAALQVSPEVARVIFGVFLLISGFMSLSGGRRQ